MQGTALLFSTGLHPNRTNPADQRPYERCGYDIGFHYIEPIDGNQMTNNENRILTDAIVDRRLLAIV
jgi:hypothetical protein